MTKQITVNNKPVELTIIETQGKRTLKDGTKSVYWTIAGVDCFSDMDKHAAKPEIMAAIEKEYLAKWFTYLSRDVVSKTDDKETITPATIDSFCINLQGVLNGIDRRSKVKSPEEMEVDRLTKLLDEQANAVRDLRKQFELATEDSLKAELKTKHNDMLKLARQTKLDREQAIVKLTNKSLELDELV